MNVAPTRILYVIPVAWWGGSQRYIFDLANAARSEGHDVLVATGDGELPARLGEAGIPVAVLHGFRRGLQGARGEIAAFQELSALVRTWKPDIIHSNNSKGGLIGTLAGRRCGVPRIIFTAHGWAFTEARPWWQRSVFWLAHYLTVILADRTICVSADIRRHALRMPFIRGKLLVIHNGIAPIDFYTREDARKRLMPENAAAIWVGTIAELHPNKNLGTLIHAFAEIAALHPETCVVVMGEGMEREKLESAIEAHHLSERIHLLGHVPEAARYLRALDIFAFPSRNEALGYALLEAGEAHLPAIGSRVGGIPEIIENGTTGILFPSGDTHALAHGLSRYLNDPQFRERMGEALYQRVNERFSLKAMLERTLALYR